MKVAVLGLRGFPNIQGGVEKHCEELYPRLAALGADVIVFTRFPYIDPSIREYRGVQLIPIDCPRQKFLEAFVHSFKAVWHARLLRPDLVHIHAVGPSLAVPFARLLGLKVVITHHGPDYERKKWNWAAKVVLRLGEWCGCVFANCVITIAGYLAEQIKVKYGREAVVIPNGVVLPQNETLDTGHLTLEKYGLESGKYILAVGRFVPEKGFHDLIDAFARMQVESGGWKLVIAGDADHEDEYSQTLKVRAARISGVILTGRLSWEPLSILYIHAGLFALPSYYEGLPIVLLEAMSYGLSCVVSDIPANREVKLAEERYVKPGDVSGWAAKIAEFAACSLAEAERSAQLDLICRDYNWDTIAERTLAVYRNLEAFSLSERQKDKNAGAIMSLRSFLLIVVGFLLLTFLLGWLGDGPWIYELTNEDHAVENLQFVFCLLASILFFIKYWQSQEGCDLYVFKTRKNVFFLLMALGLFFVAGEEISWGQRILGIQTPEAYASINFQQETNLHNLEIFKKYGKLSFEMFLKIACPVYFFIFPILIRLRADFARFIQRIGLPIVPFLFGILYYFISLKFRVLTAGYPDSPDSSSVFWAFVELRELDLYFLIMMIGAWFLFGKKTSGEACSIFRGKGGR